MRVRPRSTRCRRNANDRISPTEVATLIPFNLSTAAEAVNVKSDPGTVTAVGCSDGAGASHSSQLSRSPIPGRWARRWRCLDGDRHVIGRNLAVLTRDLVFDFVGTSVAGTRLIEYHLSRGLDRWTPNNLIGGKIGSPHHQHSALGGSDDPDGWHRRGRTILVSGRVVAQLHGFFGCRFRTRVVGA